jgi:putative colanic acid biosynthesis UDP-glucose lipid carrier transferase
MLFSGRGRYSKYIRPISMMLDIVAITALFPLFFNKLGIDPLYFGPYQAICWLLIALFTGFYEVYRYTTPVQILAKLVKQGILLLLVVIAFFPFYKLALFSGQAIAKYMITAMVTVGCIKFLLFYYLKRYRIVTGSNFRNTIIIGYTPEAIRLKNLFETRVDYGYRFFGFFSDKKANKSIAGKLSDIEDYILKHSIDDIYCSISEVSNERLQELLEFADINNKVVKFIPDNKDIFSKNLKVDYYELFPVLSLRKTPLHEPMAQFLKRLFDIVFSLLVILLILSWLTPLLALLIKLESKGPVFFKQSRPGINEGEFFCYKFRSMQLNETTEQSVIKNDPRVTRIGKFIRKTSIDEMPQFFNVIKGEMSVVGPRPHLWSQNNLYSTRIKRYVIRHDVKPGITGLAQVRGFRGEISTDEDMINRIKYDVFYIEKLVAAARFKNNNPDSGKYF